MADSTFIVLDAASATVTFRAQAVVGTTLVMMSVPSNLAGTAIIGQSVMASAISVAIASNQSNVPINIVSFGGTALTIGQQVVTASIPVALPSNQIVSTNLAQVGGSTFTLGQKVAASSLPVAIASDQLSPLGQTVMASSAPVVIASDQSNVPIGVVGYTSFPSAVANATRVPSIGDKIGRVLVAGAARAWKATQTATITTGAELTIVNPINATTFADIYGVLLANTGATTCKVDFRYGTGSAIVFSVESATGVTSGWMLPVDSAIPGSLSTANVSWTAQASATAAINVSTFYVQNI